MKKIFSSLRSNMYLPLLIVVTLVLAFCFNTPKEIFLGYYEILKSPSILITDYLEVSNLGATFFNIATILIFNMFFVKRFNYRMSGPIFSGLLIISGFSFFGKNIFNTIPIYLGIYLFSKFKKTPFKNYTIVLLLSTGISPLVSYCFFGFDLPLYYSIPLGVLCGLVAGFIVSPFSTHTIKFYNGYNIYNTGFALGIISMFFYAIFQAFGLKVETVLLLNDEYHYVLLFYILGISLFFILVSILHDPKCLKKYKHLLKRTGRLISDFPRDFGYDTTLLNVGIIGVLCIVVVVCFKIQINGPVAGAILSAMGISAFGVHFKNFTPVLVGTILATILMRGNLSGFKDTSIVLAIIFSAGLSPIAKKYGVVVGIIAGMLHVISAPLMIGFQGGFDLYNMGFVAGFTACVVVVLADNFIKGGEFDEN